MSVIDFTGVKAITIPEGSVKKIIRSGVTLWEKQIIKYTNQIPISTDTDGSIYNGKGYKESVRINSSLAIVAMTSGSNPAFVTGCIPVKPGDVIRLKNCFMDTAEIDNSAVYGNKGWGLRIGYCGQKRQIANSNVWTQIVSESIYVKGIADANGIVKELTILDKFAVSTYKYIRLCLAADKANGFTPADAIVTVNEPID